MYRWAQGLELHALTTGIEFHVNGVLLSAAVLISIFLASVRRARRTPAPAFALPLLERDPAARRTLLGGPLSVPRAPPPAAGGGVGRELRAQRRQDADGPLQRRALEPQEGSGDAAVARGLVEDLPQQGGSELGQRPSSAAEIEGGRPTRQARTVEREVARVHVAGAPIEREDPRDPPRRDLPMDARGGALHRRTERARGRRDRQGGDAVCEPVNHARLAA